LENIFLLCSKKTLFSLESHLTFLCLNKILLALSLNYTLLNFLHNLKFLNRFHSLLKKPMKSIKPLLTLLLTKLVLYQTLYNLPFQKYPLKLPHNLLTPLNPLYLLLIHHCINQFSFLNFN
jgi:hypothetical protein